MRHSPPAHAEPRRRRARACLHAAVPCLLGVAIASLGACDRRARPPAPVTPGTVLLADTEAIPEVRIGWGTWQDGQSGASGQAPELRPDHERGHASRPIGSRQDRTTITPNLETFVCIGGTRHDMGLADPRGASVSVGFYKLDHRRPLFEHIERDGCVTIELRDVRFNQPVRVRRGSVLQHAKFDDPSSVLGCTVAPNELNLYNSSTPGDDLQGRITPSTGRVGAPTSATGAACDARIEPDGTLTLVVRIPYALFQHADDRWTVAEPGLIPEPYHFHVECEVLPDWAFPADAENAPDATRDETADSAPRVQDTPADATSSG